MENKFKQEDKDKLVEFLNFIGQKAKLNDVSIQDNIKFFGMLTFVQKELIPKIEANILEITKVVEASEDNTEE